MNHSFHGGDVAALLRIAGEVGELRRDLHLRRTHILNCLLSLVGGCFAVCSEVDPSRDHNSGWAHPNSITCSSGVSLDQQRLIQRYLTGCVGALDPCIPPLLRENKPVFTIRRIDVIGRSWFESSHYNEVRRPLGFGESMYSKLTLPGGRRLKLSFHREMSDLPFTQRDAQVLHVFHENLARLYLTTPLGSTDGVGSMHRDERITSLPARVRPVLQRLLAGDAEKQAALALSLSPHTVHEYVKVLYRTFGVNSRGELLAQFVSENRS